MSLVFVFVVVVCCCYFIQRKYRVYLVGSRIAGPWAVPLLGNVQLISKIDPQYLYLTIAELRAKYRQSFRLWLGPQLWVFLHSPAETRDALNDGSLVKADTFQQLQVLLGHGLLVSDGKHWESHRRILGPAFHPNVLNNFPSAICEHAKVLQRKIAMSSGEAIEVSEYLFPCILDAIMDTSMGKMLNSQVDPQGTYTHAFHRVSELLFKRMVNPVLAPDFVFHRTGMWRELTQNLTVIHNLMNSVIHDRAELLKEQSSVIENARKSRLILLDTLLTAEIGGRRLSFDEIRDEVNTFIFAGVDTTTAAMGFVLYALARYPTEQSLLLEELEACDFDIDCIGHLEYLDMFIKESIRLYTIVPLTGRQTTRDTVIGGRSYCAGVTLWINMYGLAHDPELFDDPYEFRPQRFSKEQQSERPLPPFSFIPFSGGPHVCIGRKYSLLIMKILTVKLLQNFKISVSDPDEELILMAQMVLKSLKGINLKFEKREEL